MKKIGTFLLIMSFLSCSKKFQNFSEVLPIYWKSTLSAEIEIKDEWAYPSNKKNTFVKNNDKWVFCFVELRNLNSEHSLSWKWFNSKGELHRESPEIKIGVMEERKNVIAWDKIKLDEEKEIGKWSVVIFLDGKSVDSKIFEIR
jgi:hypothetical protein